MGRIAEALKRAQQERARRGAESTFAPDGDVAVAAETVAAPSSVSAPPPPQPFAVTTVPIVPDDVDPRVVVFHEPTSAITERYRSARTRLLTGNPNGAAKVFGVTSSLPREGKTISTANLGFSLAELRHLRVVIVDSDLRQRGLSRLFKAGDKPGLAELIRGEKSLGDTCLPVVRGNLFLVPAGDSGGMSPSELLAGSAAAAVFHDITERFHYALVDVPAVHTVADVGLIAPLCHALVIVIRMGKTPEPVLRRCVRMLQANHLTIAGSILAGYCDESMGGTDTQDYYAAMP